MNVAVMRRSRGKLEIACVNSNDLNIFYGGRVFAFFFLPLCFAPYFFSSGYLLVLFSFLGIALHTIFFPSTIASRFFFLDSARAPPPDD